VAELGDLAELVEEMQAGLPAPRMRGAKGVRMEARDGPAGRSAIDPDGDERSA
jgi:hypothetical protein